MKPITVDLFSDVVCPWCFIGDVRLNHAIDALNLKDQVVVRHHPYALMPDTSPEGLNIHELLRARYGREPKQIFAPAEAAAKESGIDLDLSKQQFSYPTMAAHTLLRHAQAKGTVSAMKLDLFKANFQDALNVSDPEVLASVAVRHGFTKEEALAILRDENELAKTREETDEGRRLGIRGVPFFIFGGAVSVSGAQSEGVLQDALLAAQSRANQ